MTEYLCSSNRKSRFQDRWLICKISSTPYYICQGQFSKEAENSNNNLTAVYDNDCEGDLAIKTYQNHTV